MTEQGSSNKYLVPGMVISMLIWGLSWPSNKVLTNYCSVVNFTVYRYAIVIVTMLLLLKALKIGYKITTAGIPAVVASGVLLALYCFFLFKGLKSGTAGAGGVLVSVMNPVLAYVIGIVIGRKLPVGREFIGLVLGLVAGVVLLKAWENTSIFSHGGNLYFLLAALTWSVMSKVTSFGSRYGMSLAFSLWQYAVTFLCLIPLTDFAELQRAVYITDPLFWLNLFFGSAIVTALATTIYFYTTTRLGSEKASSFIFLVPFGAAVSSRILLGETIHWNTSTGGMLGIAAVYIMIKKK